MSYVTRAGLLVLLIAGCDPSTARLPDGGITCNPGNGVGGNGSGSGSGSGSGNVGSGGNNGGGGSGGGGGSVDGGVTTPPAPAQIRVHYPAGTHAVTLRGDSAGLNWTTGIALTNAGNDTWVWTLPTLTQPLQFKPLLDDTTWSHGPNYVVQPGASADVYPHFVNSAGQVVTLISDFHSTILNNDRTIYAYLPASYGENTDAHYPVLYMHDGQNLFDPALAFGGNDWKVGDTLDAAGEDGSIAEIIVIGIANTAERIYEYTPTTDPTTPGGGGGDEYLQCMITELKPQIDSMLRTIPDRAHTGIMGSSLGGLISAYAGVTHADVYGIVGVMSPSTWWDNDVIITDVMMSPTSPRPLRVYVDSGDSGTDSDDVTDTDTLATTYLNLGLATTYLNLGYVNGVDFDHVVQAGGQHNEIYWAERFPGAAEFLFGPRTP